MQGTLFGTEGLIVSGRADNSRSVARVISSTHHVWKKLGPSRVSGPQKHCGDVPAFFYTSRRFPPILIRPDAPRDDSSDESQLYEVRIIDNDYNTYQEVMDITMLALGIDSEQAFSVAWEVDHRGDCVVAHAPREEAEALADVIRTIGIEVQVNPISRQTD